jgi:hypothetical protein
MACTPIPTLPMPSLPGGITLTPPETPDPGFSADLCCKILQFAIPTPPIPLPPGVVNAGTAAIIKTTLASVQAYLDALPVSCPRE